MNKEIENLIKNKEELLFEARITQNWLEETNQIERLELHKEGIKEIEDFVEYLKKL